jgi:hypothetical protein
MPLRPGIPPAPPSDKVSGQCFQINGVTPGYVRIHTPPPITQLSNPDVYARYCNCDEDVISDMLTDDGTSTG